MHGLGTLETLELENTDGAGVLAEAAVDLEDVTGEHDHSTSDAEDEAMEWKDWKMR